VLAEPAGREIGDDVRPARLLEEVACAWHDDLAGTGEMKDIAGVAGLLIRNRLRGAA
jgi:hypothetical protein